MRVLLLVLLAACGAPEETPAPGTAPAEIPHATAPAAPAAEGFVEGTVAEVLPAGGYVYIQLDAAAGALWAAVPETPVAVGDQVAVTTSMPMRDFHSETLGRDFELIYFAQGLGRPGAAEASAPHGAASAPHGTANAPATSTAAPEGASHSVAQVFAASAALAGKTVTLRGRVVKSTPGVMGRNWLHLKDGTGAAGTDDLTVTTTGSAAVGTEVEVKGTVVVDQDFGHGYSYPVMVTDAEVTAL